MRVALTGILNPSPAQGEAGLEIKLADEPRLLQLTFEDFDCIDNGLSLVVLCGKLAGAGVIGGLG